MYLWAYQNGKGTPARPIEAPAAMNTAQTTALAALDAARTAQHIAATCRPVSYALRADAARAVAVAELAYAATR